MASSSTGNDSSNSKQFQGERRATGLTLLTSKISQLKKQIQAERADSVKEKIMKNREVVESDVYRYLSASNRNRGSGNMLSLRMQFPTQIIPGKDQRSLDKENNNNEEEANFHPTANLPIVQKLPPFTTYIHTTRNQKMNEDQSVKGKRRIYYEHIGGEALIYTDHIEEEQAAAPTKEKHEFSETEKRIIRTISQDYEPSEKVFQTLARFIGGTTSEIQEEFRGRNKKDEAINQNDMIILLDKSLASSLDTFDTLFCRRCLVFDCSLHGNGQPIITPAERLEVPVLEHEQDDKPCSDQCYKFSYVDSTICDDPDTITWKPLLKDLYLKGVEIFGTNSCLVAKNLLPGLKTCMEVYTHMHNAGPKGSLTGVVHHKEQEKLPRLPSGGRKGKGKKAGGHPTRWRIADGKQQSNNQYTPCQCNSICGKDCTCLNNSTCCEKYCGCSKSCKNRFRGCHCAKSQCRSQQCPCFAAARECEPDTCRNCWVSCGGGSLGEPPRRGQGLCGNMRLLLRQQQRILLGISDVAGWGAFVKNTVEKDDYLGEYTGELISQEEADLRGQLYDRANSSFLFNLNDQYVIDAFRQGNKLKFANHSANPNCYASIIKVGGDHRVGIFAKRSIEAGEEIFYDYCYGPEQSPFWARKPNDENGGPSCPPQARSKKPQPDDPKEGPSVPSQAQSKKPQSRS